MRGIAEKLFRWAPLTAGLVERINALLPARRRIEAVGAEVAQIFLDERFDVADALPYRMRGGIKEPMGNAFLAWIVLPQADDPPSIHNGMIRQVGLQDVFRVEQKVLAVFLREVVPGITPQQKQRIRTGEQLNLLVRRCLEASRRLPIGWQHP